MALTTIPASLSATALTLTTAAQPNITSVGTLTGLTVSGDLTVDTSTLVVDATNNRVGIGTSSPESGLHLFDGTNVRAPQNANRKATLTIEAGSEGSADIQMLNASYNHIFFGDAADANVGYFLYDHTNNSMQFATNAAEAMRIDSTGSLGLGVTNMGSNGLSILNSMNFNISEGANSSFVNIFRQASSAATVIANGYKYASGANAFASSYSSSWAKSAIALNYGTIRFYTDSATITASGTTVTPTERMRIDSSGNVGIGTTTPGNKFTLYDDGGYWATIQRGNSTPGGNAPWLGLFNNINIANATYGWGIYDSNADGSFQIWNKNNSTTGYNTFTIKRGGNVGIGASSPSEKLHVVGASINVERQSNGAGFGSGVKFSLGDSASTTANHIYGAIFGVIEDNTNGAEDGYLSFQTSLSGSLGERMRIASNGDLHFGGTNQGRIKASGNSVYIDAIPASSHIIFRNNGSIEKMHITDTGSVYHPEQGSNGDYTSYIGSVSNSGSGARYAHVNISTAPGDMFWIEVIGYDYANSSGSIYGRSGGYIYTYLTSTTVYSNVLNGDIVAHYQLTNGTYEAVVDTKRSDTTNRWGSMVFRGGTDTINATQPLEIIQYSYTGTTAKVY